MRVLAHSVAKGKTVHKVFANAQKDPSGRKNQKGFNHCMYYRIPWSEWRDSNPRPLHPQYSALPGCATLRRRPIIHYSQTGTQAELRQHHLCLDN